MPIRTPLCHSGRTDANRPAGALELPRGARGSARNLPKWSNSGPASLRQRTTCLTRFRSLAAGSASPGAEVERKLELPDKSPAAAGEGQTGAYLVRRTGFEAIQYPPRESLNFADFPSLFFFTSSLDVDTGASPARIGRRRGSPRCRARPAGVRATAAGPPSTGAGGGGSSGPAGGRGSVRALLGCATVPAVGASWRRLLGCHGSSSGCGRGSPAPAL